MIYQLAIPGPKHLEDTKEIVKGFVTSESLDGFSFPQGFHDISVGRPYQQTRGVLNPGKKNPNFPKDEL